MKFPRAGAWVKKGYFWEGRGGAGASGQSPILNEALFYLTLQAPRGGSFVASYVNSIVGITGTGCVVWIYQKDRLLGWPLKNFRNNAFYT